MPRPIDGNPNGFTPDTQKKNSSTPGVEGSTQAPIITSGMTDTRYFLIWLKASCPSVLWTKLRGENFMVVPATADGIRGTGQCSAILRRGYGCEFPCLAHTEPLCMTIGKDSRETNASICRPRESGHHKISCTGGYASPFQPQRLWTPEDRRLTRHFIVFMGKGVKVYSTITHSSLRSKSGIRVVKCAKDPLKSKCYQRFGNTCRNYLKFTKPCNVTRDSDIWLRGNEITKRRALPLWRVLWTPFSALSSQEWS